MLRCSASLCGKYVFFQDEIIVGLLLVVVVWKYIWLFRRYTLDMFVAFLLLWLLLLLLWVLRESAWRNTERGTEVAVVYEEFVLSSFVVVWLEIDNIFPCFFLRFRTTTRTRKDTRTKSTTPIVLLLFLSYTNFEPSSCDKKWCTHDRNETFFVSNRFHNQHKTSLLCGCFGSLSRGIFVVLLSCVSRDGSFLRGALGGTISGWFLFTGSIRVRCTWVDNNIQVVDSLSTKRREWYDIIWCTTTILTQSNC